MGQRCQAFVFLCCRVDGRVRPQGICSYATVLHGGRCLHLAHWKPVCGLIGTPAWQLLQMQECMCAPLHQRAPRIVNTG